MPGFDLVVVSPNSAIDSYYSLAGFQRGGVNLSHRTVHTAGGKGFNLARAALNLGGRPLALGVVGGQAGKFIDQELEREGIAHHLVWGQQESRRCNTLHFAGDPDTTVVLEPGLAMGDEVAREFAACILAYAQEAPYLLMTGSLLPDFPPTFYADLVRQLKGRPVETGIDCSGPALAQAVRAGAHLVKVNASEFTAAFLEGDGGFSWEAVRALLAAGRQGEPRLVVVTNGPEGAYLFPQDQAPFQVVTPVEQKVSTAGSGDSFFAGLVLGLGRGESLEAAARLASAAGAANLLQLGCGVFDLRQVRELLEVTRIIPLKEGSR